MKILLIFLIALISTGKDKFENTTWAYNVANSCVNILKLEKGKKVREYDCELNYTLQGSYILSEDTLRITLKDDSHPEDGNKAKFYIDKYLIKGNCLLHIGHSERIHGIWKFEIANPKNTIIYRKIN